MKSKISLILFLLLSFPCFGQNDFRIISSDLNSISIEYTPKVTDTLIIKYSNEDFVNIILKSGIYDNKTPGIPSIPYFSFPLGVPSEFGNNIQVVSSTYKEIPGKMLPAPRLVKIGGIASEKFDKGDKYFSYNSIGEDLSGFGTFGLVRGVPVQLINIKPIQFNAVENRIRIYTKILIKITFPPSKVYPVAKDAFLADALINYPVASQWKALNENKLNKTLVNNSVLSTGKWYKFEAPDESIYKITKSMLSTFGIDANTVDPRTIKIFNNSGNVLPENVTTIVPTDLVENAVYYQGDPSDGKFHDADFILFYGRGTNFWEYDSTAGKIVRRFNPYSKQNYYWITSGGTTGKRMQNKPSEAGPAVYVQSTTKAFAYNKDEKINIAKSGRTFLGDEFNPTSLSHTYSNKLDGVISGSQINYLFNFVNSSLSSVELKVDDNGNVLYDVSIPGYSYDSNPDYASGYPTDGSGSFIGTLPDSRSLLKFTFNASGVSSKGYLNWFEIYYNKSLTAVADQLLLFSKDTSAAIEYDLSGFTNSNIRVFDVSDYANIKVITNPLMLSGVDFRFISTESKTKISRYLAVGNDNLKSPSNPVEVSNSNIHGFQDGAKLIIVTPKEFKDQALRLQSFKQNHPKFNIPTYVADIDQVFNEFSCGMKDVSGLRNFFKYAFENWTIKPEYILLLGDGTYDYKNIEGNGNNYIIPWETENFLDVIYSYPMDDFYAEVSGNDLLVDLGIGRLNANSPEDAKNAVDKIIAYESETDKGNWQNLVTMVSDDQWTTDGNEGNYHVDQSEDLSNNHIPKSFDVNKIYLGAYPTVITSIGRSKPGVTVDLVKAINNGTLLVNFIGHGSPELWTHERVFENSSTIPQLTNDKLFFLTAATCDFGYYDIPTTQSGAELLVLKPGSGAIGAFTSARPVFSIENAVLNNLFYDSLLSHKRDTLNLPITVGKAYFMTKLVLNGQNDQKYHLFCDPSLRLDIPQYSANFDSINGTPLVNLVNDIQIKALSNTRINGTIKKVDNSPWTNFTGEGILSVFDSQRQLTLSEQDNYPILVQGGIIFRGRISVTNGKFNSGFIVPKDISYENNKGKVVLLFFGNSGDGLAYTNRVIIGGTDTTAVNNNKGPEIDIYFDDVNYKNSYLINPDSKLIIRLSDASGLNTTGTGIGHKIEGILNDNLNNPIDFTNYFTGDLDAGGKSGQVVYQFNQLDPGHYKLQVKAWDVFNNFSTAITYFDVVSGNSLEVSDVYNYPNPFSGKTTFTFQQNLAKQLDIKIKVFTVTGRMIREIDKYGVNEKFVTVEWDGRDQDGSLIANGAYFYKVILKSTDGQFSKSVIGKLAVIR
jgi:hypothetical protein